MRANENADGISSHLRAFQSFQLVPPVPVLSDAGLQHSRERLDELGLFTLDFSDLFKIVVTFGRLLLQVHSIWTTFSSLNARDPEKPLNQARHVVAWAEVLGLAAVAALVSCAGLQFAKILCGRRAFIEKEGGMGEKTANLDPTGNLNPAVIVSDTPEKRELYQDRDLGSYLSFGVGLLQFAAGASSLRLISNLSVDRVVETSKASFKKVEVLTNSKIAGIISVLVVAGVQLLLGWLGLLSLMVKIQSIDFVLDTLYTDWTGSQDLLVLALASQVAGIREDAPVVKKAMDSILFTKIADNPVKTAKRVLLLNEMIHGCCIKHYDVIWAFLFRCAFTNEKYMKFVMGEEFEIGDHHA